MKIGQIEKVNAYIAIENAIENKIAASHRPDRQPAITISRQTGTRGHLIGEKLVDYLNKNNPTASRPWTLFDKGLISTVIEDHHLPARMVRYLPEDKVSEIASTIEEILGLHPSNWTLIHETMETILRLAELGNTVIYGRGGNIITAHLKKVLNVRLVGSMVRRIPQAAEQYDVSLEDAPSLIIKEDRGRKRYIKSYFDKDIDDPLLYGLFINTDEFSDEAIVKTIADLV